MIEGTLWCKSSAGGKRGTEGRGKRSEGGWQESKIESGMGAEGSVEERSKKHCVGERRSRGAEAMGGVCKGREL